MCHIVFIHSSDYGHLAMTSGWSFTERGTMGKAGMKTMRMEEKGRENEEDLEIGWK